MLTKDNPIQGVATYFEYQGDYGTYQAIFTPHGFSEDDALLRPYLIHRTVLSDNTRAHWKRAILALELPGEPSTPDEYLKSSAVSTRPLMTHMNKLAYGKWTPTVDPISVEVSKRDLSDLRNGKTPTALMLRIDKTRKALGLDTAIEGEE